MSAGESPRPLVALVPAAGRARRLGRLESSKEILQVGWRETPEGRRPRRICDFLLAALAAARIERAYVLLRRGKQDVPECLGDGRAYGLRLAYLVLDETASVPETLDAAFPWVGDATVALGFPDIWFEPRDGYARLLRHLEAEGGGGEGPAAVLGLVASDQAPLTDMVDHAGGRVRRIRIKEPDAGLRHAWTIAVWTPRFTRFLHDHVAAAPAGGPETHVGHVFQAAVDAGLRVDAVVFPDGAYLDVGVPENLERARRRFGY